MKTAVATTLALLALSNHGIHGADVNVNGCDAVENTTATGCDLRVKVLGQSGKIVLSSADKQDAVTITMDSMTERNDAGEAIGTSGSVKHSFNSFASQDFEFGEPSKVDVGNATATALDFNATLIDQASLKVTIFAIASEGVIEVSDSESFVLSPGSLKFNIEINDWPFCSAGGEDATLCTQGQDEQVGAFLDVDVIIKGKNEPSAKNNETAEFDLGDSIKLELSQSVSLNGVVQDMPEGFPKMELKGGKQVFTFRFPRFDGIATYDPVISGIVANDVEDNDYDDFDDDNGDIDDNDDENNGDIDDDDDDNNGTFSSTSSLVAPIFAVFLAYFL